MRVPFPLTTGEFWAVALAAYAYIIGAAYMGDLIPWEGVQLRANAAVLVGGLVLTVLAPFGQWVGEAWGRPPPSSAEVSVERLRRWVIFVMVPAISGPAVVALDGLFFPAALPRPLNLPFLVAVGAAGSIAHLYGRPRSGRTDVSTPPPTAPAPREAGAFRTPAPPVEPPRLRFTMVRAPSLRYAPGLVLLAGVLMAVEPAWRGLLAVVTWHIASSWEGRDQAAGPYPQQATRRALVAGTVGALTALASFPLNLFPEWNP